MLLSELDFPFDPTLVADRPVEPRDGARLLVMPRPGGPCTHRRVSDLPHLLKPGDLLVVNDTKVLPVRLSGRKRPGGGRVELVFVKEAGDGLWEVLCKGSVRPGQALEFGSDASATVVEQGGRRTTVRLSCASFRDLLARAGQMPLPPYIKRAPTEQDRSWYQTVFAARDGAVAAPTAGLHFTERLLTVLQGRGIRIAAVTLHVGPATFRPITTPTVEDHRMGTEWAEVPADTAAAIARTKAEGGRVVAVGTTVVRTLESAARADGTVASRQGDVSLFITPGYRFKVVDVLMTNFHLPHTTLLLLVSAFTSVDSLRAAYAEAVREKYRFYSYGDAMLML